MNGTILAAAVLASGMLSQSPEVVFRRASEALERLTEAQVSYCRKMETPNPIKDSKILVDRKRWPPKEGDCFFAEDWKIKKGDISNGECRVRLAGEEYIVRSQYVQNSIDDPEFTWPRILLSASERKNGKLVLDEIRRDDPDVMAVIASHAMQRRRHVFQKAGVALYFDALKNGKYAGVLKDGTEIAIEAKDVTSADIKWIRSYKELETRFMGCREIEGEKDRDARLRMTERFDDIWK